MYDRLHEPYRWRLIKGGLEVRQTALNAGALGCAISGAGPSILALCLDSNSEKVSTAMSHTWEAFGVSCRTPVLNLQTEGSQWREEVSG